MKKSIITLFVASGMASAGSVCWESKGISDPGFARVTDDHGATLKDSVFVLGEEDEKEFKAFLTSENRAAMDPNRTMYIKHGNSLDTLQDIQDCPKNNMPAPIKCPHGQVSMTLKLHGDQKEAKSLILFALNEDASNNKGIIDWQAIHDIAASPDLLEQLKAALGFIETPGDFGENDRNYLIEDIEIAIRKATGGA